MSAIIGLDFVERLRQKGLLPWVRPAGMSDLELLLTWHRKGLIRLPEMAGAAATATSTNDTRGPVVPAGDSGWLTAWQAAMTANTTITPAATFVAATSVTTAGGGRYVVLGQASVSSVASTKNTQYIARLTDGTTEFSNAEEGFLGAATGAAASNFTIPVMGMILETSSLVGVTFTLAVAASVITDAPVVETSVSSVGATKSATQIVAIRIDNTGPAGI